MSCYLPFYIHQFFFPNKSKNKFVLPSLFWQTYHLNHDIFHDSPSKFICKMFWRTTIKIKWEDHLFLQNPSLTCGADLSILACLKYLYSSMSFSWLLFGGFQSGKYVSWFYIASSSGSWHSSSCEYIQYKTTWGSAFKTWRRPRMLQWVYCKIFALKLLMIFHLIGRF